MTPAEDLSTLNLWDWGWYLQARYSWSSRFGKGWRIQSCTSALYSVCYTVRVAAKYMSVAGSCILGRRRAALAILCTGYSPELYLNRTCWWLGRYHKNHQAEQYRGPFDISRWQAVIKDSTSGSAQGMLDFGGVRGIVTTVAPPGTCAIT